MNNIGKRSPPLALIIDDDAAVRLLLREVLEQDGLAVAEAADGEAGLALFDDLRPDLVALDVVMPAPDGFAVCAEIRRRPHGRRTPVLMLTGLDDDASITRAYDCGATDFISKPLPWSILRYRVRYMLRASQTLEALARSEARLADAQRMARLGHWEWDPASDRSVGSDEVLRLLGTGDAEAPFRALRAAAHADDRPRLEAAIAAALASGAGFDLDLRLLRADGEWRTAHLQALAEGEDAAAARLLRGTLQDISERRQAEEQIRRLSYFDSLTGLPNRAHCQEQLDAALAQAARAGRRVAVLLLDLDRFQRINDTFGHSAGDRLLTEVAGRLSHCLRGGDYVARDAGAPSLARVGGDEFIVVLAELAEAQHAAKVVERIRESLSQPFSVAGQELRVSASVGIALFPNDGEDSETLLKNADAAMYHAKSLGRNGYQFYDQSLNATALATLALEHGLGQAIARDELRLHYQPQVELATGRIVGLEALVRWQHPERGLVPPAEFIPLAEESGLIVPLGAWVLRQACVQNKAWQQAGLPPLRVAVNVSGPQFADPDLPRQVAAVLAENGLEARWLELELTESVLMKDFELARQSLKELKKIGVGLALDDFGTGYSSLSYLKRFPMDTVKIDQSFVREITFDPESAAIARAVIAMAHSLKLKVVAEGVETAGQLASLRAQDCDEMQGFLFARPLPAAEAGELLRARRGLAVEPQQVHGETATVLLVDDETSILAALRRLLRTENYRVLTADNARLAFELLALNPVQVIVTDQRMPEMSGIEFLSRAKELYPDTVRIMLSGYTELKSVTEAVNRGAIAKFLTKPWDDELLRSTLREAFQQSRLLRRLPGQEVV